MKSKIILSLVLSALMAPLSAFAADGSSGCGPGWYAFKDNSLVSSALRSTTNGILFPVVTIGMTVGSSNCTQHKIVKNEKRSLHFVTMNYYELKSDMAKGDGQYINALASTLGCNASASAEMSQKLQGQFSKIYDQDAVGYGAPNAERTLLNVYKAVMQDSSLAQQCGLNVG